MRIGLIATGILVVLQLFAVERWPLVQLDALTLDARFLVRGPQQVSGDILILLADDATVDEVGRWPWPRRRFADIVDRLTEMGAATIAIDLLFPEPDAADPDGDRAFAEAVARSGRVVLAVYGDRPAPPAPADPTMAASVYPPGAVPAGDGLPRADRLILPYPALAEAAAALGHVNLYPDGAGRSSLEALALGVGDQVVPPLALAAARLRLGVETTALRLIPGRGVGMDGQWIVTDAASRLPVNYLGPAGTIETVRLSDLWTGALAAERVRGRVVLVGAAVTGLGDRFATPFDGALPGVERHAMLVETILTDRLLRRDAVTGLVDIGVVALVGIAATALALLPPLWALGALGLLAAAVAGGVFLAFAVQGVVLAMVMPLAAVAVPGGAMLTASFVRTRREARRIREAFGQYLHPHLVARLVRNPRALKLGGEERVLTVLFSDIRGFTGLSERLAPDALVGLLGDYMGAMTAEVLNHGGYVDKYIGDGILAVFGAPVDREAPALDACRCALAMQRVVADRRGDWARWGVDNLRIGVGVHTGPMIVGNVGGAGRLNYTVLGDAVNVGARLESATKTLGVGIAIGATTWDLVADWMTGRSLGPVALSGRAASVEAWELTGER